MSSIRPLIPLLIAASFLIGGNGAQVTLIALRGSQEGFSPSTIGLIGTAYFLGFLLGCVFIIQVMRSVGHIRTFSALAAIGACATLTMAIAVDVYVWMAMRFICGFCFAGSFTVIEAWLNAGTANHNRARVTAIYRIVDIGSVTGAQFLIPAAGSDGFTIFAIITMLIALALVPVSLGDKSNPKPPSDINLDLARVWMISPLASVGSTVAGLTNGGFRTMVPVYAQDIGFSVTDIATFISTSIIGGALIQYPLGSLSDRWDRRLVLLITATASFAVTATIWLLASHDRGINFLLIFLFGCASMPLYSLSAAQANDRAGPDEFVLVSAGMMMFYSIGAIVGPSTAAIFMGWFGAHALFLFSSIVYLLLIGVVIYRIRTSSPVPAAQRSRIVAMLRRSLLSARLLGRKGSPGKEKLHPPRKAD